MRTRVIRSSRQRSHENAASSVAGGVQLRLRAIEMEYRSSRMSLLINSEQRYRAQRKRDIQKCIRIEFGRIDRELQCGERGTAAAQSGGKGAFGTRGVRRGEDRFSFRREKGQRSKSGPSSTGD